jgi:hypothetical protein
MRTPTGKTAGSPITTFGDDVESTVVFISYSVPERETISNDITIGCDEIPR